MTRADNGDQWWLTAIGYCLDVERFFDDDGDGHGDLSGLAERMDHLVRLGVTVIWLQPFYPSPENDDGYDVSDYYDVESDVGNLGHFVELVRVARERGIRVIVDLVVNHTSAEHAWFQDSRSDPDSRYRDWYIWRDEPNPADAGVDVIFPDQESSLWAYDDTAGQYYRHSFYRHQPDLNNGNPQVRNELLRIMGFWLQLGVAGFRVDAVPYAVENARRAQIRARRARHEGEAELTEPLHLLDAMRTFLARRSPEAVMLGEVNLPYSDLAEFVGGLGDRLTLVFDFVLNQQMWLALARRNVGPIVTTLRARPELAHGKQWGLFARNHDELTLDQLTDAERDEVFAAFGPEPEHQIFGRGLRRRVPSMLGGDQRRVEMVYSLVFSLPGTPVVYYGEEIGMGENLDIPGRLAVRTPMQWDGTDDGGFSAGRGACEISTVPSGDYAPAQVNVADQMKDPTSLLAFFRRMADHYRSAPELGRGEITVLDQPYEDVLAHVMQWENRTTVAIHNVGAEQRGVDLHVPGLTGGERLWDLFAETTQTAGPGGTVRVDLPGFGYCWLRISPAEPF